jgi:RNA polymerase sigma factor (sigma-70 family)
MVACAVANLALTVPCSLRHAAALEGLPPARRALVEEALSVRLSWIDHGLFTSDSAEKTLFEEGPSPQPAPTDWYHPVLAAKRTARSIRHSRLLTSEEERHLFLRYNYARCRAAQAVEAFRTHASRAMAESIALWYGRVKENRDLLARANLALVLSMARRNTGRYLDLGELISEGNLALLHAIDGFDVSRGFKFSTYACRAMLKAFRRLLARVSRYHAVFPAEFDSTLEQPTIQDDSEDRQAVVAELQRILLDNRARLSEIEQTIIQSRFALCRNSGAPAMTLEEVSQIIGVTRERVRQIQNQALAKIRAALECGSSLR